MENSVIVLNDLFYFKLKYKLIKCIIITILFLIFIIIVLKKRKKNYNKLDEKEKNIYNNFKSKTRILVIVCIILCIVSTILRSAYHFYNTKKSLEEMVENGFLIQTSSEFESKIVIVERYFVLYIFIYYLIYRFLLKINSKLSQDEKNVHNKVHSSIAKIIIIQTIVFEIVSFFINSTI